MPPHSILIVEDESIVALDLSLQLQDLGYEVLGVAASGERAIEMVGVRAPDLILMDVRLQGRLDGIEAAQQIRDEHDVPVIFLTSHSDNDTVQRAARTAPYGYLTKPYQIKELRAGIEVALTKSRMERQLRQADRWFAHTLRCVSDGVIVTDVEAKVRFVNPAAEGLTGWSSDEAVGRPVDEVVRFRSRAAAGADGSAVPPEPGDAPGQLVRSVLQRGRPLPAAHGLELVARDGSGRFVDETAGPVDDDDGGRLGAVLVLRDIDERVAQETLLRASEERFRNAFDHAPLGMALVSLAGEILQVNDALCRLVGADADTLKHCKHHSLTLEADRDHERQRLNELSGLSEREKVVQFERRYRRLDGGEPVWTLVSVSLMHEGELPTCHLYQVHDLTQQKLAAQQLAELAEERLKREASDLANAAKSEFLSRASHEMRTPLNAVIGFAQLLQMLGGKDPGKTETYANHIRMAGEHLLTLVSDLLDLNRVSQGTLKIEPQPLVLLAAVRESLELLGSLGESHGVSLALAVPDDLHVMADPTRLRQVLLNLGSNAIKYNRQGGGVNFSARRVEAGRVCLTVADTGIGMTAEQLERLFQPFDRLGLERTRIPGVGLGLVIARSLVIEMGGSLTVESRPRDGTTISIDLAPAPAGS